MRREAPIGNDLECGAGVGFLGEFLAVSLDGIEEMAGEERFDNFHGI